MLDITSTLSHVLNTPIVNHNWLMILLLFMISVLGPIVFNDIVQTIVQVPLSISSTWNEMEEDFDEIMRDVSGACSAVCSLVDFLWMSLTSVPRLLLNLLVSCWHDMVDDFDNMMLDTFFTAGPTGSSSLPLTEKEIEARRLAFIEKQLKGRKAVIKQFKSDKHSLNASLRNMRRELATMNDLIDTLRTEGSKNSRLIASLEESYRIQEEALDRKLLKSAKRKQTICDQREEIDTIRQDLSASQAENNDLQTRLSERTIAYENETQARITAEEARRRVENENTRQTREIASLTTRLETEVADHKAWQDRAEELDWKCEGLEGNLARVTPEMDRAKRDTEKYRRECNAAKRERDALVEELYNLRREHASTAITNNAGPQLPSIAESPDEHLEPQQSVAAAEDFPIPQDLVASLIPSPNEQAIVEHKPANTNATSESVAHQPELEAEEDRLDISDLKPEDQAAIAGRRRRVPRSRKTATTGISNVPQKTVGYDPSSTLTFENNKRINNVPSIFDSLNAKPKGNAPPFSFLPFQSPLVSTSVQSPQHAESSIPAPSAKNISQDVASSPSPSSNVVGPFSLPSPQYSEESSIDHDGDTPETTNDDSGQKTQDWFNSLSQEQKDAEDDEILALGDEEVEEPAQNNAAVPAVVAPVIPVSAPIIPTSSDNGGRYHQEDPMDVESVTRGGNKDEESVPEFASEPTITAPVIPVQAAIIASPPPASLPSNWGQMSQIPGLGQYTQTPPMIPSPFSPWHHLPSSPSIPATPNVAHPSGIPSTVSSDHHPVASNLNSQQLNKLEALAKKMERKKAAVTDDEACLVKPKQKKKPMPKSETPSQVQSSHPSFAATPLRASMTSSPGADAMDFSYTPRPTSHLMDIDDAGEMMKSQEEERAATREAAREAAREKAAREATMDWTQD